VTITNCGYPVNALRNVAVVLDFLTLQDIYNVSTLLMKETYSLLLQNRQEKLTDVFLPVSVVNTNKLYFSTMYI
jgi:hypothetical protein